MRARRLLGMAIIYRIELWCSGDCCTRHMDTIPVTDLSTVDQASRGLLRRAVRGGWAEDGSSAFCPRCQRDIAAGCPIHGAEPKRVRVGGGR